MTYPFVTKSLDVGTEVLELRGLSLPHLLTLVSRNEGVIERLYTKAITGQMQATTAAFAMELGENFSDICGLVIAFGAGKTDAEAKVYGYELPMGYQLEALEIIGQLTMSSAGGAEKFWEIINNALAVIVERLKL
jgi:hypothetical protein